MRITIINQFYPPDLAPTGVYLAGLVEGLRASGHQVRILTGNVGYDGQDLACDLRDCEVQRVRMPRRGRGGGFDRLLGYFCFAFQVWWRLVSGSRSDVLVALTTPPFLGWVVANAARFRGIDHAHWVMDVWPDALTADRGPVTGLRRWLIARLEHLARHHFGSAKSVIAIGEAMVVRLRRYRRLPIDMVPLWSTVSPPVADEVQSMRTRLGWKSDEVVFAYCGNLGRGHRWIEFAEAALQTTELGIRWVVVGGGVRRAEFMEWSVKHPQVPITFLPYQDEANLPALLASVDVHLVSVEQGWEGVVVPSKMQNLLAVGRPAIVVAPYGAEPARWVRLSGAGWTVAVGDVAGAVAAVRIAHQTLERLHRGKCALAVAKTRFGKSAIGSLANILTLGETGRWWHDRSES